MLLCKSSNNSLKHMKNIYRWTFLLMVLSIFALNSRITTGQVSPNLEICPTPPHGGDNTSISSYLNLINSLITSYLNRISSATGNTQGSLLCTPATPATQPPPPGHSGSAGSCGSDCNACDGNVGACNADFPRCYVNYQNADCSLYSTIRNNRSFTACNLRLYCENPATGELIPGTEGTPNGCEGIGNQRTECYYSWNTREDIDCDRTYRLERESCLAQIGNQPQGNGPGTVSGAGLPSCANASPGQACTSSDGGAVRCRYSNQQEAFYCGQFGSAGSGTGYCLPGQTANCFPAPNCTVINQNPGAYSLGQRTACQ